MQILETLTGIVIMVFTYLKQTIIMAFTNLKQTIIMLFTFLKQTIIMVFDYLRETLTSWVAECKSRINSDKHLKYSVYTPNNDSADDYCPTSKSSSLSRESRSPMCSTPRRTMW